LYKMYELDKSYISSKLDKVYNLYYSWFMRTISATEAKQNFAALIDSAQREPIIIRRHNRDLAVVVSPRDFERIRRANIEELKRLTDRVGREAAARGMNEQVLAELLADEESGAAGR
jgi:prevent-host-death family protein